MKDLQVTPIRSPKRKKKSYWKENLAEAAAVAGLMLAMLLIGGMYGYLLAALLMQGGLQ